ncbi:MAG TPA: hypothetical protein VK208_02490, partial [Pyrinomonadaceae bacterium]|nr:hypothetical protein [Pyrinomonadaceae bacterium]
PASDPPLGIAIAGVPISAPRPFPKPERAIAPEATGTEFSTQTAKRRAVAESHHAPSLAGARPVIGSGRHRFRF